MICLIVVYVWFRIFGTKMGKISTPAVSHWFKHVAYLALANHMLVVDVTIIFLSMPGRPYHLPEPKITNTFSLSSALHMAIIILVLYLKIIILLQLCPINFETLSLLMSAAKWQCE